MSGSWIWSAAVGCVVEVAVTGKGAFQLPSQVIVDILLWYYSQTLANAVVSERLLQNGIWSHTGEPFLSFFLTALLGYNLTYRCIACRFDALVYCKMITTIKLANTSIMSQNYHFFVVVGTFKMCSPSNFRMYNPPVNFSYSEKYEEKLTGFSCILNRYFTFAWLCQDLH